MHPLSSLHRYSAIRMALTLLVVFIVLIYSNTFQASWHLDDFPNLVINDRVHMESITWQGLADAIHGGPKGRLLRPVAYVSFALNWFFGGKDVFGYHLVNLLIHILCTILLFFTIRALFRTPVLRESSLERACFTAVLAAMLWAIHPIQTQAVTYIVQRMAQLAALFYLAGTYSYLRGRMAGSRRNSIGWFAAAGVSFLLALGSKQNAITLPLALLLFEAVFFQPANTVGERKKFWFAALTVLVVTVLLGSLVFLGAGPWKIFETYKGLTFTPLQRLLTESRVVLFYLFQILLPLPRQFSIDHHFALSKGLFAPWTTFPAVLSIGILIALGIALRRRYPLAGFAVLFFFLNHIIESGIAPLQLVFEHRNYLPTLFFFAPIAAAIHSTLVRYRAQRATADAWAAVFLGVLLAALGYATYTRNSVWLTEKSLWTDAHLKAPAMSRPLHNLAWGHYEKIGQYRKALNLYMRALEKKTHRRYERAVTYSNIAGIYFDYGYNAEAVEYWRKALAVVPSYKDYRFRMALALSRMQQWDRAMAEVEKILQTDPDNGDYRILKGRILLQQNRPRRALDEFRRCLHLLPREPAAAVHCGMALEALQASVNAAVLYRYALTLNPASLEIRWRLAAAYTNMGKTSETGKLIEKIVNGYSLPEIQKVRQDLFAAPMPDPVSYRRVAQRIADRMQLAGIELRQADKFDPEENAGSTAGMAESISEPTLQ